MKNVGTYGNSQAVARKSDVDAASTGGVVSPQKAPVRAISLLNVNTASPGAAHDGVTLANGDRLGLVRQTSAFQNGIYIYNGATSALTRATDFDSSTNIVNGSRVFATDGVDMKGKEVVLATDVSAGVTVGTTVLDFMLPSLVRRVYLTADAVNNNSVADSLQDIGNLSQRMLPGIKYRGKLFIVYSAAATSTGSRWAFRQSAPGVISMQGRASWSLTVTSRIFHEGAGNSSNITGTATNFLITSLSATSATTVAANICEYDFLYSVSADVNLIPRFSSEVASSAITAIAGVSYLEVEPLIS